MRRSVRRLLLMICAVFALVLAATTGCSSGQPNCDDLCNCLPQVCSNGKALGNLNDTQCKQVLEMSKAQPGFNCTSGSDASTMDGAWVKTAAV